MKYNRSQIVENFRNLIGFAPSYDISNINAKMDESLSVSDSGQFVNDIHTFFTAENFANCSQQFSSFAVALWDNSKSYIKDDIVNYNDTIYRCLDLSINEIPVDNNSKWSETTLLSVWFLKKYDAAVLNVIESLFENKKLEGHGKPLRGNTALFNSEGIYTNYIDKSSRFVGFAIDIKEPNLAVTIQRLGLQFTGAATIPMHYQKNGEDEVVSLEYSRVNKFHWFDPAPVVITSSDDSLIIGYYEDDVPNVKAIKTISNVFSVEDCDSCRGADFGNRKLWDSWISVKPISILDGVTTEHEDTNWGVNLVISFACDLSDIIIREKDSLVPAIKAQLKVSLLESLGESTRNNQQADQISNLAYNQVMNWEDPDSPKRELKRTISALNFQFSEMNSRCMPVTKNTFIRNRVI